MKKITAIVLCIIMLFANSTMVFADTTPSLNVEFEILVDNDQEVLVKFKYNTDNEEFLRYDFSNASYIQSEIYDKNYKLVSQKQIAVNINADLQSVEVIDSSLIPMVSPYAWSGWFDTASVQFGAVNLPGINAAADAAEYILEAMLLASGTPLGAAASGLGLLSVKLARTVLNEKLATIYGIKVTQLNQQDYPYQLLMRYELKFYKNASYTQFIESDYTKDWIAG